MDLDTTLNRSIIFGVLLTFMIPSIICSLFILSQFIRSPELCKRLNNHIVLALILVNFIQVISEMPFTLIILHTGFVAVQTPTFCLFWIVYNYTLGVIGLMYMGYGCIERYFLIFHRVFFNRHLIILHYGPLVFLLIYPPLLYFGLIVIYPCQASFDYTQSVCGGACYEYQLTLGLFDWLTNVCAPVIVGAIATAIIIIRYLLQKRRVGQREIWRRNRKMIIQLAFISIMYVIVWIPTVVCFVVPLITPDSLSSQLTTDVFNYCQYFSYLLCPFMCLIGLPELRYSLKKMFTRQNLVRPALIPNLTALPSTLPPHQKRRNHDILKIITVQKNA